METQFSKGAHPRLIMLAGAILLAGSAARAQAEPAPPFLTLLQQAQETAPRLAESLANIRAAEGQTVQAGVRPNPIVGLETENIGQSYSVTSPAQEQTTLSVSQALETGGKRSARISAAGATLNATRLQNAQANAIFAYDLAIAYVGAELYARRADLAAESLARAQEDERAARALVNAGREADLRAVQANAAVTAAQADVEAARADVTESLVRLSGLVGHPQPYTGISQSLLALAQNLPLRPAIPVPVSPEVRTAEALRNAAAQRVGVERSRSMPDVTVSLGLRRIAGENATAVIAGVSVPLPLFDNNSGNITTAGAELSAAEARLNAARLNAEADWRSATEQAAAAGRRLRATADAEAAANEAYRLARVGYDAGRTPLLELQTVRRGLTDAQTRSLEAATARIRAEATLARLMGRIPFGETP